jgi:hypothetical protein
MANILKKEHTRLRVHATELPLSASGILGAGIDVTTLPEGHLSCPQCQGFKFECWVFLDAHKIECGCMKCGWSCRLLIPMDVNIDQFGKSGRFTCMRRNNALAHPFIHENKGMIIIHNSGTLSVGCEACKTEIDIKLKTKTNLVLAQ